MRGIDVSAWQTHDFSGSSERPYFEESDFVIIKASEGNSYVSGAIGGQLRKARDSGKLVGFYHFARGGNPTEEADHFVRSIGNYRQIGDILIVDHEPSEGNGIFDLPASARSVWLSRFWYRVRELTGLCTILYCSLSEAIVLGRTTIQGLAPLWVAAYWDSRAEEPERYNVPEYGEAIIWQFTSDPIDRDLSRMSRGDWVALGTSSSDTSSNIVVGPRNVSVLQSQLGVEADGVYGPITCHAHQRSLGIPDDGYLSGQQGSLMRRYAPSMTAWLEGWGGSPTVAAWQKRLGVEADGIIGHLTASAICRAYPG